jgi:hypothetical protein
MKTHSAYQNTAALNIVLLERLSGLLKAMPVLQRVILLKGASLLHTVYADDVGARHLGDVDLLVRKESFSAFKNFLSSQGYVFSNACAPVVDTNCLNSVICTKDEGLWPSFHIHWHLVNAAYPNTMYAAYLDMDRIWKGAEPLAGFRNVFVLAPYHQLIHLCEHALKHSYAHGYFLQDIDRLLGYYGDRFSWDKLIPETKIFHLERPVYYSLYFVHRLCGTMIPAPVLEALEPREFAFLEKRFSRAVLKGRVSESHLCDVVYLAMHQGMKAKLRFMRGVLSPPQVASHQCALSYPKRIQAVHYLERSVRGLLQYLKAAQYLIL